MDRGLMGCVHIAKAILNSRLNLISARAVQAFIRETSDPVFLDLYVSSRTRLVLFSGRTHRSGDLDQTCEDRRPKKPPVDSPGIFQGVNATDGRQRPNGRNDKQLTMNTTSSEHELHSISFASPSHHQEIFYSNIHPSDEDELVNTSYLLLDLPTELLDPVKKQINGQETEDMVLQMELRGRNQDEVVLTTPHKTFQLRTVQNSNSVMICGTTSSDSENHKLGLTVLKLVHETVQLTDVTSFPGNRLDRIKELLHSHLYTGETNEAQRRILEDSKSERLPPPVTLNSLSQEVRASDSEISGYLRQLYVIELDGSLRMISLGYLSTILSSLLKTLDELGVAPQEQFATGPVLDIMTSRSDIRQAVLLQILQKFLVDLKLHPPYDTFDPQENARLKTEEVVNLIGLSQLLCIKPTQVQSSHNPKEHRYVQKIKVETFLASWKSRLPEPFSECCAIESLSSHSILSDDQATITVIPIDKLSLDPKTRMSQLFEIHSKWKIEQIEPFLKPITGGGIPKKFDELVLKFCRKIKEPAPDSTSQSSKLAHVKKSNTSETVWLTARNKW
ncbi:hypothetical protein PCANC_16992 [Puccinia coronata f. sp. avenae]|uniref:Sister chromatid cohesion protein DCC1 n=1 Tax=Puccinia coronata f. sp. avenae TaxID=200324 RepID=A0A2N5SLT0_9BASI|nr:hypothetical protein PCANC_16992 [Puccinia coronata f. sp. avenae]